MQEESHRPEHFLYLRLYIIKTNCVAFIKHRSENMAWIRMAWDCKLKLCKLQCVLKKFPPLNSCNFVKS